MKPRRDSTRLFKMRKPYDKTLDQALNAGVSFIHVGEQTRKPNGEADKIGYKKWMYFLRKQKETQAFQVRNARWNHFMVCPRRRIVKRADKENKKYNYYQIM
jgi:hypothetical protein